MFSINPFFKPTVLYKEFIILDLIEKNSRITQRAISQVVGMSVSMVNDTLKKYEDDKLFTRYRHSKKTVEYLITKKGIERKKVLNIGYLNTSKTLYFQARENFEKFLQQISDTGFKNILLYGAGEVAEMMLHTVMTSKSNQVSVLAVIDDDPYKIGSLIGSYSIISRDNINLFEHDGILISTYSRKDEIKTKLLNINYPSNRIIEFFE